MMGNKLFPSVKEAVLVIVITAFFLILTAACIGLRPEHFLMAGVFLALFLREIRRVSWRWHSCRSLYSAFRMTGCGYIPIIK